MTKKHTIYIDMDNTLCDYLKKTEELGVSPKESKHISGFFESLEPIPGAIEAFNELFDKYNVYILTTSPWSNPEAACEKFKWVKKWLPKAYKRVIISHHKNLCGGDILIDDSPNNGASEFTSEWIQFRSDKFPDWNKTVEYIKNNYE